MLLFELIAGKRPFTGDDFFTLLAKIVLQDPPRLRDAVAGVPPELDALVRRAMSKAAADRFVSARDLADAIAAVPAWEGQRPQIEGGGDARTSRVALAMSASIEQRVVTVLFASAADDASSLALAAIAEQHGASCHPTLGRRMIAVFGVDRTHGDEAVRAGRAALLASARVPGASLSIATGRALSGTTGLTGDLLERGAGELEGVDARSIEPRPIPVDEATAALLDEHFVIEGHAGARSLLGLRPAAPRRTPRARRSSERRRRSPRACHSSAPRRTPRAEEQLGAALLAASRGAARRRSSASAAYPLVSVTRADEWVDLPTKPRSRGHRRQTM